MRKFTYSRMISTAVGPETFVAVEFDSFDEARKAVDKGIYERKLELEKDKKSATIGIPTPPIGEEATVEIKDDDLS